MHKLLKRLRKGKKIRPKDLTREVEEHLTKPRKAKKAAIKELGKWLR